MQGSSLSFASSTVNGRRPFPSEQQYHPEPVRPLGLKLKRARFLNLPQRAPSRSFVKVLFPSLTCSQIVLQGVGIMDHLSWRHCHGKDGASQVWGRRDFEIHLPMQKLLPSHLRIETCEDAKLEPEFNVVTMWALLTLAANITWKTSPGRLHGWFLETTHVEAGMTDRDLPDCEVTWHEFAQIR
jgi:hypothetical protein